MGTVFDWVTLDNRLLNYNTKLSLPEIYTDTEQSKILGKEIARLEKLSSKLYRAKNLVECAEEFYEIADEEELEISTLENILDDLLLNSILNGKYDNCDAILTLHAGAGGTEACDWTDILYRMYIMYCEKMGFNLIELDRLAGDGAGIKSVTFRVEGENAYGYLKAEKGIHRLVRISPFDANKRRHTSFASLEVIPDLEKLDNSDIILKDEDLDIGTFRSSGAGGQHVNKTESAIRIIHKPTGITVKCQEERSQVQNKEKALEKLKGLLKLKRDEEQMEELSQIKGSLKKIEWGSQIRSYVFCPYTLVKDHRTGFEISDIQKVIDGNIQDFIYDYLKKISMKEED